MSDQPDATPTDTTQPDGAQPDGTQPDDTQHDGTQQEGAPGEGGASSTQGSVDRAPAARGRPTGPPPRRTGVFLDPRDLREHVSDLLRAFVGNHQVDQFGNFSFDHDSTRVFVAVQGGPAGPVVSVFSVLATNATLTPDLAGWMAVTNHQLLLGTLSWDPDNNAVWLRHNLMGSHLDLPELQAAVQAIAGTAAQLDEMVVERFGGEQFPDDGPGPSHPDRPGASQDDADDEEPSDRDGGADLDAEQAESNASGYL